MAKKIVQKDDGRRTLEEVAQSVADERIKETEGNGELDFAEKGKIRKEIYESMLYGGSYFGREND